MLQKHSAYKIFNKETIGPFIFSCEHASNLLPNNIPCSLADQHFLKTHWGWDIGAQQVVEHLTTMTNSTAISGTVSRLWVDLNRDIKRQDLIRTHTDEHELSFNKLISTKEHNSRLVEWYHPFHNAYHKLVEHHAARSTMILISIHSFTPVWDGKVRTMDIGVLFDQYEELGSRLAEELQKEDLFVECNEPYTGRGGLMYSVEDKGTKHNCPHLELEINQALICTPERALWCAHKIHSALNRLLQYN